jgi:hypothetical protein
MLINIRGYNGTVDLPGYDNTRQQDNVRQPETQEPKPEGQKV